MRPDAADAAEFERHRAYLLAVGYRLTGSVCDAEDAVQESWFRLSATDRGEIRELRAWLTTVVSRICLDRLAGAARRRETYVGQWLPEPIVFDAGEPADPLAAVVGAEDARFAALVVLDALTPPQRVAFVLHDGFAVPFPEIATILGVTVDAARHLAARARRTAARARPVPDAEHTAAVTRLLAAFATGDVAAVVAVLHPDAVLIADGGGEIRAARNVIVGPDRVARFVFGLRRMYGDGLAPLPVLVNGQFGLMYPAVPERPLHVLAFEVCDGRVRALYDLGNPAKLTGVRANPPTAPGTNPSRNPAP
ncbi:RNA polymerase sigma factor SigJ [Nocardia aurantia]|uniref:ECF RNA polymerase sigma factor SigJ n=1 Tax=Nocardia aurantia TaxID=2585199 RepID=A0A7K0DP44_9NOCA|nr:RNA polymerase sigma factor SigJ [Nocardia aurantia]MQY26564.1 ECF RNA polymerase sigma factor SigJ [Nocardia aurantia]